MHRNRIRLGDYSVKVSFSSASHRSHRPLWEERLGDDLLEPEGGRVCHDGPATVAAGGWPRAAGLLARIGPRGRHEGWSRAKAMLSGRCGACENEEETQRSTTIP